MENEFKDVPLSRVLMQFTPTPYGVQWGVMSAPLHKKDDPTGRTYHMGLYGVCVGFDGLILDVVDLPGLGGKMRCIQPSVCAYIMCDQQGKWGRTCPDCKRYFRTNSPYFGRFCPYCGHEDHPVNFITENQKKYIKTFCEAMMKANYATSALEVELGLPEDEWSYPEQQQQTHSVCEGCKTATSFDISGEYGGCPACRQRNSLSVLRLRFEEFSKRLERGKVELAPQSEERKTEWGMLLVHVVSLFEAMARDLQEQLLRYPTIPRGLADVSFQDIFGASEKLEEWFGFTIAPSNEEAVKFLRIMLQRRHLFAHKGGVVDEEYIQKTHDKGASVGRKLRLESRNIGHLKDVLMKVAEQLVAGFEKLVPPIPMRREQYDRPRIDLVVPPKPEIPEWMKGGLLIPRDVEPAPVAQMPTSQPSAEPDGSANKPLEPPTTETK